tara:strand:+ start:584 stop:757 length:174 start_codon:yes stop_codon:yes gene_type:complete
MDMLPQQLYTTDTPIDLMPDHSTDSRLFFISDFELLEKIMKRQCIRIISLITLEPIE